MSEMPEHRPQVVIVGGGFGGLAAARALRRTPAEVILIDRHNHHVFQPLLYQVATSALTEGHGFAGWARPAGVLIAGILTLRRAPFPLIVVLAAATTAVLRLLGVP